MNNLSVALRNGSWRLIKTRLPFLANGIRRMRMALKDRFYKKTFQTIYERNIWGDRHSISGTGSNLFQTEAIRRELPRLTKELGVNSMLDIPCGDFFWMQEVKLGLQYIGGDIVPALVESNQKLYSDKEHTFARLDLIGGPLPKADLIFCRDCLVHFSYDSIFRALDNMRRSGSKYLLTTTFIVKSRNDDIATGDWRPINLQLPPFNFPPPLLLIDEKCPFGGYEDKHLGLWNVSDIPV